MNDLILGLYRPMGDPIAGGMGKVLRVHHTAWNVDLAMKQPHPHLFQTEAQKQNFIHECEAWIHLGLHPHIVSCHYVREVEGIPSIFSEWMDGGSLADWIKSEKLYEGGESEASRQILDIAIQFAWGLDYAHEQGMIHQDVKPDNVLLTSGGDVKVADFGIAKAKMDLTLSGSTIAQFEGTMTSKAGAYTPAYCAPEQSSGNTLSRRTDIWSWAVSVMEMFVGERLWSSGSVAGTACDTYFESARVPVPESVKDLLRECFTTNEAGRPHDFKIVADRARCIYQALTGNEYAREFPEAAKIQGDSLNNRAVSVLDLGRTDNAEKLFAQALAIDPGHPQATYNQGQHLWRSGRMTDDTIVRALEQSQANRPGDWNASYLLGLIHMERKDAEGALAAFSAAKKRKSGFEVQKALTEAERMESCAPKCLRTFEGHAGLVDSVALSGDGRWALSGSWDKTLRLWEVSSGKCIRIFEGHTDSVSSLVLSADGRWALSGSYRTLRLWEVSSGKCLRTFEGHASMVNSVELSADGRWALSGSSDKTLRLWDVSSGNCLRIFEGNTGFMGEVNFVKLSADGCWALSGSQDSTLRLWEVGSGKCLRTLEGHTNSVSSVAISGDGHWTLSGSADKTLRLWDVSSGKCLRTFKGHTEWVESVALSTDGRWALSGSRGGSLRLWEVSSGRCLRTIEGHTGSVSSVALSADGYRALTGSWDKSMRLWELRGLLDGRQTVSYPSVVCRLAGTAEILAVQNRFHALLIAAGKALSNGESGCAWALAAESRDLTGHRFSIEALDIAHQAGLRGMRTRLHGGWYWGMIEEHRGVAAVALSADGRRVLSGCYGNTLRLWDVRSRECLRTFEGHTGSVCSVALSADGHWVLSGSSDNTLRLWDVSSGNCLRIFKGHRDSVNSVALSGDGRWVLSGSYDNTLRLWNVNSGKCLRTFKGHTGSLTSVALSGDGRWALSGSYDKILRLWNVSSGKCLRTFKGHTGSLTSVALSGDGRWALSGSYDNTLRLWDVSSGKCLRTFQGHTKTVKSVALSVNGRWALSGSSDNTLRFWEMSSGNCLKTFDEHSGFGCSVALSADGRWALSGSKARTLSLWELEWNYEFPTWADWDEDARPSLVNFLWQHTPYAAELPAEGTLSEEQIQLALTRRGKPIWANQDFQQLVTQLQYAGFGWIRPEGVMRELEKMAANWPKGDNSPTVAFDIRSERANQPKHKQPIN